jgi:predicted nucleotidyltransferase
VLDFGAVPTLDATSLSADERRLLARFSARVRARYGDRLHGVWLYGSRARGEPPVHEDSDVDVLVLVGDEDWHRRHRVYAELDAAARELDLEEPATWFAVFVETPARRARRREIGSFFIAEVDRDKVVVEGQG